MDERDWNAHFDLVLQDAVGGRVSALEQVRVELREYEIQHGMTTKAMRRAVVEGRMVESETVLAWLMLDNRRRALVR